MKSSFILLLLLLCPVLKAEIRQEEHVIYVSGDFTGESQKFREMAKDSRVRAVIFRDSAGGAIADGLVLNKIIEDRQLATSYLGFCHSSCAIALMGGVSRHQQKRLWGTNTLSFHVGRVALLNSDSQKPEKEILDSVNAYLIRLIWRQSNYKIPKSVIDMIKEDATAYSGVFFRTKVTPLSATHEVFHCGAQSRVQEDFRTCTFIENADLVRFGILTE